MVRTLRRDDALSTPVKGVMPVLRKTLGACAGAGATIRMFGQQVLKTTNRTQSQINSLQRLLQAVEHVFRKLIYNVQRHIGYIIVELSAEGYDKAMLEVQHQMASCIQSFIESDGKYESVLRQYTSYISELTQSIVKLYSKSGEIVKMKHLHVEEANHNALIALEASLQTVMDIMNGVLETLNDFIFVRYNENSDELRKVVTTLSAALQPDGGIIVSDKPVVMRKSETNDLIGQYIEAILKIAGELQVGIIDGSNPASYSSFNGRWDSTVSLTCLENENRLLCASKEQCFEKITLQEDV